MTWCSEDPREERWERAKDVSFPGEGGAGDWGPHTLAYHPSCWSTCLPGHVHFMHTRTCLRTHSPRHSPTATHVDIGSHARESSRESHQQPYALPSKQKYTKRHTEMATQRSTYMIDACMSSRTNKAHTHTQTYSLVIP